MVVLLKADVTLNGQTVTATVYEDTDGDGTAENQESWELDDGVYHYQLRTLTGGTGNDYWVNLDFQNDGDTTFERRTASATVHAVTLETEPTRTAELTTDVTLNGETLQAVVNEDLSADGSTDTREKLNVGDGVTAYDLYAVSGGTGNDYWIRADLSSASETASPTVHAFTLDTTLTATDAGTITTASGSVLSSGETATLSEAGSITLSSATPLSAAEIAELVAATSLTDAVATVLSAAETTFWTPGTSVTDATATTLTAAEVAELVESGFVTATATPLTPSETATLSEAPGVTTGAATVLTPDEFPVTTEDGSLVTAAATPLSASETVEDVIAGTVTLNGSGVQGAKVYVIDTNSDTVVGTATTDTNGDYSVTVPAEPPYHVAVQYDDGSQKYNALSKPYIE